MTTSKTKQPGAPIAVQAVALVAGGCSLALSSVGVADMTGAAQLLETGVSDLAGGLQAAGAIVLGAATAVTGVAAILAAPILKRRLEDGDRSGAALTGALIAAAIGWNLVAGHQGAQAISDAGVAARLAPLEARLEAAKADARAAEAAASAVRDQAAQAAAANAQAAAALQGAIAGNYLTAGTRALTALAAQGQELAAAIGAAEARVAEAEALEATAQAALSREPREGYPQAALWALALLFELFGSPFVFAATPRRVAVAERIERAGVVRIGPQAAGALDDEALEAALSAAASTLAVLRHAKAHRAKAGRPAAA